MPDYFDRAKIDGRPQTVEVPTTTLADGRLFIRDEAAVNFPWVREFIRRFPAFWQRNEEFSGWTSS